MTGKESYGAGQEPPWPRLGGDDLPRGATLEELAKAWFDPDEEEWAEQDATEVCYGNPEATWEFILLLLNEAKTHDDLGRIAAGPLEGFVQAFAHDQIDRIEREAEHNARFRTALKGVWFSGRNDDVTLRLRALGCHDLNAKA
ncbi:MAG: DUF6869 domain-containing protein [Kiritimatiellia bacterium]|jgi:hypothetical protein